MTTTVVERPRSAMILALCGIAVGYLDACHAGRSDALRDRRQTDADLAVSGGGSDANAGPEAVLQIAAGLDFTCALSNQGHVYCWGANADALNGEGRMFGSDLPRALTSPTRIPAFDGATKIASGGQRALCFLRHGVELWCTGAKDLTPHPVVRTEGITALAVGQTHVCAIDRGGDATCGLAGIEPDATEPESGWPYRSLRDFALGPRPSIPPDDPWARANVWPVVHRATDLRGFGETLCVFSSFGRIDCRSERSGSARTLEAVGSVVAWDDLVCGRPGGGAWSCPSGGVEGHRTETQLDGLPPDRTLFVDSGPAPGKYCAVSPAGEAACGSFGTPVASEPWPPLSITNWPVASVAFGRWHACLLGKDGTVRCWGRTSDGRMGGGQRSARATPDVVPGLPPVVQVVAQVDQTCALEPQGAVWCWGREFGSKPRSVGLPKPVSEIGAIWPLCVRWKGDNGWSCRRGGRWAAVPAEGRTPRRLWSWGGVELRGIADDGSVMSWVPSLEEPQWETAPVVLRRMLAGARETSPDASCVIDKNADVLCICHPRDGIPEIRNCRAGEALHRIDALHGASGPLVHLRSGDVCARVGDEGKMACWTDRERHLADGPLVTGGSRDTPSVDAPALAALGSVAEVALSTELFTGIASGFACARSTSGRVSCWGLEVHGALGKEGVEQASIPIEVEGLPPAHQISLGSSHACALGEDHRVYCWGDDGQGQLGDGFVDNLTEPVAARMPFQ